MTTEQIQQLAYLTSLIDYTNQSEVDQIASDIFNAITLNKSAIEIQTINTALLNAGVDAAGLCKKKRPQG